MYFSQWKAVAFRLPLTQQEASSWWYSPPSFHRLHTYDFLPHSDTSGMRNIWTMRQEKMLVLAQVLQCCAEGLGAPPGVLCDVVWELQKCVTPLMSLNWGDIVEALLLEPMGTNLEPFPPSSGKNWSCWRLQKLLFLSAKVQKLLSWRHQLSELMLQVPMPLQPSRLILQAALCFQKPHMPLPRKQRNACEGLSQKACHPPTQTSPDTGSSSTSRRVERYLTGGGNSRSFATRVLSPSVAPYSNP